MIHATNHTQSKRKSYTEKREREKERPIYIFADLGSSFACLNDKDCTPTKHLDQYPNLYPKAIV